jgi:hypothetical protein
MVGLSLLFFVVAVAAAKMGLYLTSRARGPERETGAGART